MSTSASSYVALTSLCSITKMNCWPEKPTCFSSSSTHPSHTHFVGEAPIHEFSCTIILSIMTVLSPAQTAGAFTCSVSTYRYADKKHCFASYNQIEPISWYLDQPCSSVVVIAPCSGSASNGSCIDMLSFALPESQALA